MWRWKELSGLKGSGLSEVNLSATGASFQAASSKTPSILMVELILLAANCFFSVWLKAVEVSSMQKHNAFSLKHFMAILFGLRIHHSWRNDAGTKLNVPSPK